MNIDAIPGMRSGATKRNVVVAVLYFLLLPFFLLGVFLYVLYAVGTNRHGLGDKLANSPLGRIPTIANGGLQAAVTVAVIVIITFAVLGAALPADSDGDGSAATDNSNAPTGTDDSQQGDQEADLGNDDGAQSSDTGAGDTDDGTGGDGDTDTGDTESGDTVAGDTSDATDDSDADSGDTDSGGTDAGSTTSSDDSDAASGSDESEASTGDADILTVEVVDVVDGDTIDIQYENGSTDTVRLLGIDTPEVHTDVSPDEFSGVPDSEAGRQCLREYGEQASAYVKDELSGETVEIRFDDAADRRGVFDRLLAYVYVDNENFNYVLVEAGYARVFQTKFAESARFYDAESDAQDAERGVWECRSVGSDSDEEQTGDTHLVVADIRADAPGNDHENLNAEYIVFRNDGDDPLDLTGWTVRDEVDHTYRFPTGFTLSPGDEVALYTGSGSDTSTELYWGSGRAIWNNGGDTIFVYNEDGALVIEKSYG